MSDLCVEQIKEALHEKRYNSIRVCTRKDCDEVLYLMPGISNHWVHYPLDRRMRHYFQEDYCPVHPPAHMQTIEKKIKPSS